MDKPRQYQLELMEGVKQQALAGHRIIVCQGSTGCGKTSIMCWMIEKAVAKGRRALMLVHRRKLVDQISDRLRSFGIVHGVIMAGEHNYGSAPVQVASRDTISSRVFRNEWSELPPADLVMVDEAHLAADPKSDHRRILERYPKATILLFSATPVDKDGNGMGPWATGIACAQPTSKLVADGHLVPVKCYAPERAIGKGGKARRGIAGDLVASWKEFSENLPTVLFCSRVSHSKDAVAAFNQAGIPAVHIDADTEDDERESAFAGMKSGRYLVISNVGIMGIGVDVPCLGCCQLYMDVDGRVAFLQKLGRIMRPYPGKTHGVLIDHAGAVFRHGFPDEDTHWTLDGNADADFKKEKAAGQKQGSLYCKNCQRIFPAKDVVCPQCGSAPAKPPKSVFAPDPIDPINDKLVEASRSARPVDNVAREKHWMTCLSTAIHKGWTFAQTSMVYKKKYGCWPDQSFPCVPHYSERQMLVRDKYPDFGKRRKKQEA